MVHTDKRKLEISQIFVAFSEYMNFDFKETPTKIISPHFLGRIRKITHLTSLQKKLREISQLNTVFLTPSQLIVMRFSIALPVFRGK